MRKKGAERRTDLSIDEDLFQPLSPLRIDRLEQARARRRTATTATMSATTTRSEKGQEDIYTRAGCFFFSDAGAVVVASGLPHTRLNPNPKRREERKGLAKPPPPIFNPLPHPRGGSARRTTRGTVRHTPGVFPARRRVGPTFQRTHTSSGAIRLTESGERTAAMRWRWTYRDLPGLFPNPYSDSWAHSSIRPHRQLWNV